MGKKDRHSKICTAQGVRDRRMRLSLHVARRFFDLQDMLGFDKASKTIEWLLSKSECAIKELITSPSSCSEEGNNKSEAAEGKNVFFGKNEPMERTKEKAMVYEHCSNPTIISPFLDQESSSYGTKENPDPMAWTDECSLGGASSRKTTTKMTTSVFKYHHEDEEKEEEEEGEGGDYNMIITNNGNFMGFPGNWEMAPF
ncbi:unnamed protein product [Cuscuta campestris]|nr:unnamed protein product [Cuscuta campestris]